MDKKFQMGWFGWYLAIIIMGILVSFFVLAAPELGALLLLLLFYGLGALYFGQALVFYVFKADVAAGVWRIIAGAALILLAYSLANNTPLGAMATRLFTN